MAANTSGLRVKIEGVDECLRSFQSLEKELRKTANGELRRASKDIAQRRVIPALSGWAATAPQPSLAADIARTARARSDREVSVRLGSIKPGISGFQQRSMKRKKQNWANVAWGSESGPAGGHEDGPGAGRNFYAGTPRKRSGYWVKPNLASLAPEAVTEYQAALARIMRKYGLI